MRQCLTSIDGGYYTSLAAGRDQFGAKGDFITSPEISQVFGELVGIWMVAEWIAQGKRKDGVYLMELGPGRGTLMDDILRTIRNFGDMASSLQAIYLVEASAQLRQAQHKLLCGESPLEQTDDGYKSMCKYLPDVAVIWVEDMKLLPPAEESGMPLIVAHEFFDALPIHIFQSVESAAKSALTKDPSQTQTKEHEWRELVVTPRAPFELKEDEPEFELSLSKIPTPHSYLVDAISPRYKPLKSTSGSVVEISPESLAIVSELATRIGGSTARSARSDGAGTQKQTPSGAALILDYGPALTIPTNSLRGIRAHHRVSPFSAPGLVDISADVDFQGLAEAALNASPGVVAHGPAEQSTWLKAMGIEARAQMLADNAATDADEARVKGAWKRLIDRGPHGMGKLYKALAILPYVEGQKMRRPVGFGGDIELDQT